MRVAVFGLGYVGSVSAACLAELGHSVVGVDVNPWKAEIIGRGQAPIVEPGLADLLSRMVAAGRLTATTDAASALDGADVSLVCVGTPSDRTGAIDCSHLEEVARQIGASLDRAAPYHVVIVRSTVLPGVLRGRVLPALEAAGGRSAASGGFGFCVNPEFLRESTAIQDFRSPPFTLIGALDERSAATASALYAGIDAPVIPMGLDEAPMVKYASNAYHALKITFANEIGALCRSLGVDAQAVMQVFCRDDKLNVSAAYLRPGFAFGGSCLPKDVRALLYQARHADVDLPLLGSILPSNDVHLRRALDAVVGTGLRRIGVIGLSFKTGTDDLRESPLVHLIETLLGKGFDLRVYDEEVSLARIFGGNREYIDKTVPHLDSLMCRSLDELLGHAEVIVIGKRDPKLDLGARLASLDRVIVDLQPAGGTSGETVRIC